MPMKTRRWAEFARLGNVTGMKACSDVANIGRPMVGTIKPCAGLRGTNRRGLHDSCGAQSGIE
jgi:hypothetical protein